MNTRKKLLGVVLNDVEPMLFNSYFSHYDYNYYGNRYAYAGRIKSASKGYLDD